MVGTHVCIWYIPSLYIFTAEDSNVIDSSSVTGASMENSSAAAVTAKDGNNVVDEQEEKLRKWMPSKDKDNEKAQQD